jgi:hypothetical protein
VYLQPGELYVSFGELTESQKIEILPVNERYQLLIPELRLKSFGVVRFRQPKLLELRDHRLVDDLNDVRLTPVVKHPARVLLEVLLFRHLAILLSIAVH